MRTLLIAGEYPWPENSGSRMRLMTTLLGLCSLGPTELFSIVPRGRHDFGPPELGDGLEKAEYATYDQTGAGVVDALLRPWLPFGLPLRERPALRTALERFTSGTYDLVWYFGLRPWLLAGPWANAPAVLDLDDLEDQKIRARLSVPEPTPSSPAARVRRWTAARYSAEEARRWRRLRDRAARDVRSLVVCSQLDADRLGDHGPAQVAVVPNGYPVVDVPPPRREPGGPPVLLFQGTLRYPPNAHAARFLVDEVGPALRALVPDARIRLVGRTTPALAGLDDPPAVTFVGQVPEIGTELARADLVVVPIRFGSGTRVKIIEAFAHRVPVVSTTLGAEGLGAVDGEHLLVADDAGSLARACARLLGDDALRTRIVDAAYDLFVARLQRGRAEEAVRAVAREAVAR
jgi:glycosyltransferase involved in cell wall biosynthesis